MLSARRRRRRRLSGSLTSALPFADSANGASYAQRTGRKQERQPANGYVSEEAVCANGGYTRLDIVDRKGTSLAAALLLLLFLRLLQVLLLFLFLLLLLCLLLLLLFLQLLLLLFFGACHVSGTVPSVRVANLHMHKTTGVRASPCIKT